MRCLSCDVILTPKEDSARYYGTTDRIQLCSGCMSHIESELVSPPQYNYSLSDETDNETDL